MLQFQINFKNLPIKKHSVSFFFFYSFYFEILLLGTCIFGTVEFLMNYPFSITKCHPSYSIHSVL